MAKPAAAIEPEPEEAAPSPPPKPSLLANRKLMLLAGAPLFVAALGGGLWFSGVAPRLLGLGHAEQKDAKPVAPVYVDLPEMVANLNSNPRRPSYVKLQARLELTRPQDADIVRNAMPRLQDLFQTYLREMRPEELRGSAGTYRLREELIGRANLAAAPAHISDVLFTQMLIQ
jgi:flagellar protein FliL